MAVYNFLRKMLSNTPKDALPCGQWMKVATKTYADFSAASTTNNIPLFTLPAGYVIMAALIKHSAAFTGGAISAYTISIGPTGGTATKYLAAQNVFQAPADTQFLGAANTGWEGYATDKGISAFATSTTANLSVATAGVAEFYVYIARVVGK